RTTVFLLVPRREGKIEAATAAASPFTIDEVEHVPRGAALRADEPRSNPALPSARARHRQFPQTDLDPAARHRDHDPANAGPGNPRVEGAGLFFRPCGGCRSPFRDHSDGQARGIADEASTWTRGYYACSDAGH